MADHASGDLLAIFTLRVSPQAHSATRYPCEFFASRTAAWQLSQNIGRVVLWTFIGMPPLNSDRKGRLALHVLSEGTPYIDTLPRHVYYFCQSPFAAASLSAV